MNDYNDIGDIMAIVESAIAMHEQRYHSGQKPAEPKPVPKEARKNALNSILTNIVVTVMICLLLLLLFKLI